MTSLRRQLRDRVVGRLILEGTPADARVYAGRTRPFLERLNQLPNGKQFPAIAVYIPQSRLESRSQSHTYDDLISIAVECWAEVDPGRATNNNDAGRLQEDALDELVEAVVNTLAVDQEFVCRFNMPPSFTIDYGLEMGPEAKHRFAAAGVLIEGAIRRQFQPIPCGPLDCPEMLERIRIKTDVIGPHGEINDDEGGPDGTIEVEQEVAFP